MKQLFRNKFFIAFLLVGAILGIILIWGAYKSKDTMGLKLDIPELQGKPVKSIHFENDSLVIQSVTILKDKKFINYLMLKTSSSSPIDKLSQSKKFKVGSTSYLERSGFKIWDYPPISKKIDFSYYTKNSPIEQKK